MSAAGAQAEYKVLPAGPTKLDRPKKEEVRPLHFHFHFISIFLSSFFMFLVYYNIKIFQVSVFENVCWKELALLVFVWISFLALQIAKVNVQHNLQKPYIFIVL